MLRGLPPDLAALRVKRRYVKALVYVTGVIATSLWLDTRCLHSWVSSYARSRELVQIGGLDSLAIHMGPHEGVLCHR